MSCDLDSIYLDGDDAISDAMLAEAADANSWTGEEKGADPPPPQMVLPLLPPGGAVVLCGPSGAGKSTLIRALQAEHPGSFRLAVSHTTRVPRAGEEHGIDYYFVGEAEFEATAFVERSTFAGHSYGTSVSELAWRGPETAVVLDLNLEGACAIANLPILARLVFVDAPGPDALQRRIQNRGPVSTEELERRLREARDLARGKERLEWDVIIVNERQEVAIAELDDFICGGPSD